MSPPSGRAIIGKAYPPQLALKVTRNRPFESWTIATITFCSRIMVTPVGSFVKVQIASGSWRYRSVGFTDQIPQLQDRFQRLRRRLAVVFLLALRQLVVRHQARVLFGRVVAGRT